MKGALAAVELGGLDHAHAGSRAQGREHPLLEQGEAGLRDEGGDDGDVCRGCEERPEVLAQAISVQGGPRRG